MRRAIPTSSVFSRKPSGKLKCLQNIILLHQKYFLSTVSSFSYKIHMNTKEYMFCQKCPREPSLGCHMVWAIPESSETGRAGSSSEWKYGTRTIVTGALSAYIQQIQGTKVMTSHFLKRIGKSRRGMWIWSPSWAKPDSCSQWLGFTLPCPICWLGVTEMPRQCGEFCAAVKNRKAG